MSSHQQEYEQKRISKDELVRRFESGQTIFLGVWYGEPYGTIKTLSANGAHLENLNVASGIATCPSPYMQSPNMLVWSAFYGPQERAALAANGDSVFYSPYNFTDGCKLMRYGRDIDYYVYRVAPMDERGMFNCSMTAGWEFRALQWLKEHRPKTKIVFEVNPKLPRVHGLPEFGNNELPLSLADIIVEDDADPLDYPVPPPTDVEQRIARNVAQLVEDRDTVQLGFGTIPMAIGHLLQDRTDLGIHTEMFCEAHIDLLEAGAVSNAHKGLYDGISVATFALGTPRLHQWMKDNRDIAMLPVEETNRPDVLAKVRRLTSINSILSVDMTGQTMAHCLGPRTYSGLGGAFEFAYGSQLSQDGKSIVCLPSTTALKDGTVVSNIVAQYPAGTRITTPEHITDWVVTEHGAAHLKCLCIEERAKALIQIAHPDFREVLEQDMRNAGINFEKLDRTPGFPPRTILTAD